MFTATLSKTCWREPGSGLKDLRLRVDENVQRRKLKIRVPTMLGHLWYARYRVGRDLYAKGEGDESDDKALCNQRGTNVPGVCRPGPGKRNFNS